ncbi:hypothetical protein [Hirschia litorea]|uniref:Lipoprotein n=1 Tax=Hirschia litorea TaxID=1199156 RepID=A0ABW2IJK8_9PROT
MKTLVSTTLIALTFISLGACSTSSNEAIRTISNSPVGVGSTKEIVGKAVRTSLTARLWIIESETDNSTIASITSDGGRMAKVMVTYTADNFSIERLDSHHFGYNEKRNQISARYNRWITNIEHDIMIRTGISPEVANTHVYKARAATAAASK